MFDFMMGGRTGGQVNDLFTQGSLHTSMHCFKTEFVDLYKLTNSLISKETISFLVSWATFCVNRSSSA